MELRRPVGRPMVLAHRGSHREHAENSIEAFDAGLSEGADGLELDVRSCSSGEVVVFHDRDLYRMTGDPGLLEHAGWDRLRNLRLSRGERIPLLAEALTLALGRGAMVNVEIKGDGPDTVITAANVCHLLRHGPAHFREKVFLSSFYPDAVLYMKARAPVPAGFLFDHEHTGPVRAPLLRLFLGPRGVHPHHTILNQRLVKAWRKQYDFVNAWTVDDPKRAAQLASWGVDGIITNNVPVIRESIG